MYCEGYFQCIYLLVGLFTFNIDLFLLAQSLLTSELRGVLAVYFPVLGLCLPLRCGVYSQCISPCSAFTYLWVAGCTHSVFPHARPLLTSELRGVYHLDRPLLTSEFRGVLTVYFPMLGLCLPLSCGVYITLIGLCLPLSSGVYSCAQPLLTSELRGILAVYFPMLGLCLPLIWGVCLQCISPCSAFAYLWVVGYTRSIFPYAQPLLTCELWGVLAVHFPMLSLCLPLSCGVYSQCISPLLGLCLPLSCGVYSQCISPCSAFSYLWVAGYTRSVFPRARPLLARWCGTSRSWRRPSSPPPRTPADRSALKYWRSSGCHSSSTGWTHAWPSYNTNTEWSYLFRIKSRSQGREYRISDLDLVESITALIFYNIVWMMKVHYLTI